MQHILHNIYVHAYLQKIGSRTMVRSVVLFYPRYLVGPPKRAARFISPDQLACRSGDEVKEPALKRPKVDDPDVAA